MTKFPTLYSKGSKGEIRIWEISAYGNTITTVHGVKNGKLITKTVTSEGKNKGRANETSDEEQANLEAEAKWVKQKKKNYFESEEEALSSVELTPMLLHKWEDYSHKISYPAYVQLKVDGNRCYVDKELHAWSRAREPYTLPKHIQSDLEALKGFMGEAWYGLDGEVYEKNPSQGGLTLQEIVSAFRKENENTSRLKYWIFDVPKPNEPFSSRVERLNYISSICEQNGLDSLAVVPHFQVVSKEDVLETYNTFIEVGEEGAVVRNSKGVYEWGGRSYDALKIKERTMTEASVEGFEVDRNNEAVLHLALESGIQFKAKALKAAEIGGMSLRSVKGAEDAVGLFVEVEYENITLDGKLGKPVVHRIREVNPESWEPKE